MNTKNNYELRKSFLNLIIKKDYYKFLKNELKKYCQHGKTSTFKHCRDVAYTSYLMAKFFENRFNASLDTENLVDAAYMHDMFMYDWHEKATWHKLHGFTHPEVAKQNAIEFCHANEFEQSIIETHMWPLTLTKIPKSKEAWIVNLCDKYITISEVFH